MFENFQTFDIITQSDPHVSIHGIKGGSGPPLLLLHGYPQTHHIWHIVASQLKTEFTIIALDIRGYGASSKPSGVERYAKSVMARDCVLVMEELGFSSYFICAHDRGARVAHKLLVDYPERVRKAIFLDICPTLAMYSKTGMEFAKAYFHWFFLIQPYPLPETMISQNPRKFLEMFVRRRVGLDVFATECWEEYVSVLENPEAVHAMCEDYRAAASIDMEEAREDIAEGKLIKTPLRILWGKHGVIEKSFDALKEWRVITNAGVEISGHNVDCGHYLPEEAPETVVRNIKEYFASAEE